MKDFTVMNPPQSSSFSKRYILDLLKHEIDGLLAEKRTCKRFSVGWHRADAQVQALKFLKDHVTALTEGK